MIETLYDNPWISLKVIREPEHGVNGYVYSHEKRCQGKIVAILPYRDTGHGRHYLARRETTPCWSMQQQLSAITGGYEGHDTRDDAIREIAEETGYTITRNELINLGTSYASKSSDTTYHLFSCDLTGKNPGTPTGDGSQLEAEGSAVWLTADQLAHVKDPQTAVMYIRLQAHLARSSCPCTCCQDLVIGCNCTDHPEPGHCDCGYCTTVLAATCKTAAAT